MVKVAVTLRSSVENQRDSVCDVFSTHFDAALNAEARIQQARETVRYGESKRDSMESARARAGLRSVFMLFVAVARCRSW